MQSKQFSRTHLCILAAPSAAQARNTRANGPGDDARPMMKILVTLVGLAVVFLVFRFHRRFPWIFNNIYVLVILLACGGLVWVVVTNYIL